MENYQLGNISNMLIQKEIQNVVLAESLQHIDEAELAKRLEA